MIKKTMTYEDFNGVERKEDFYFHMTEAELMEWETSLDGGLSGAINKILELQDTKELMKIFKELITKSYGEKSPDGRRFVKNKDILESFTQTQAFSDLYMELATDDKAAAEFINGLIPKSLMDKVNAVKKENA